MDLFFTTLIFSLLCAFAGVAFWIPSFKPYAFKFLRSEKAAYLLFGSAALWFVWILFNLGEADFGQYKFILIAIFGGASILAFKHLPDFLSVRGLSALMLLFFRVALDSAFMQEPNSRLVMVTLAYIAIVAFIYFGCLPYRMRDFFEWLYAKNLRVKTFAILLLLASFSMDVSMLFY